MLRSFTIIVSLESLIISLLYSQVASVVHARGVLKKLNILSYGINHYRTVGNSIHAEYDAIRKLPISRRVKKVNMLVIRITKTGIIGNSCPCDSCKYMLQTFAITHGYDVRTVWYSTNDGFEKL